MQVYPETIVKLLGSTQGQSLKTTLAETLAAGCKNKVEAQMKRLSKVLLNSSTVSSSAKGPAKSEKSESKANKKKLRAEKKAERKNKGKKLRPNGSV